MNKKLKKLKVIFMGTPTFAVPVLEELIKNTNVILVVSQPDREKDRKVAYSWGALGLFAGVILFLGLCGSIKF